MRPRREPVPRAKDAWIWLCGILMLGILGALFIGAAWVLWENIDIRRLTPGLTEAPPPIPEPLAPRGAARAAVPFDAVLFMSLQNEADVQDAT